MTYKRLFAHEPYPVHGVQKYMRLVRYCTLANCTGTVMDPFGGTPATCACIANANLAQLAAEQVYVEAAE